MSIELPASREHEVNPRSIAIALTTFFPNWQTAKSQGPVTSDQIRGDIALRTLPPLRETGYQLVVVDGGSSPEFKSAMEEIGVTVTPQVEPGLSESRRRSYKLASQLNGVRLICSAEAEKESFFLHIPELMWPLITGAADIVIPQRTPASFASYPLEQARYEQRGDRIFNQMLRKYGLLPPDSEDLDVWFGPKIFVNTPEMVGLFLEKYGYNKPYLDRKLDKKVNPEKWPNALFVPVINALHHGKRIVSVPIDYIHPPEQTKFEQDHMETFKELRDTQFKNIMMTTIHFIRLLKQHPRSKLYQIP